VCDHLGVGLGGEDAAGGREAFLQRDVVLDDAVDDDMDTVVAASMRSSAMSEIPAES
jgi:hypothetical protein